MNLGLGALRKLGVEVRGYLMIVAASILWATMGILAKFAYAYGIQPGLLIAVRQLVGFAALLVIVLVLARGSLRVRRGDVFLLVVFGVFAVVLQRLAFFYAVDFTTATVATVLFYTYPVFLSFYAWFVYGERLGVWDVLAVVLTFVGVGFVARVYDVASLRVSFVGIVAGLAASLLFVVFFVLTKRLRSRYASWTVMLYGEGVGALVLLPVVAVQVGEIAVFPVELWVVILTIAWFSSLLAYVLYSSAIKHVKASKGSVLSVIEPLAAAVFSTIFVGERLEALQVLGIALALFGVVLLFRKSVR